MRRPNKPGDMYWEWYEATGSLVLYRVVGPLFGSDETDAMEVEEVLMVLIGEQIPRDFQGLPLF